MGRPSLSADEELARAEAKGYKRWQHREKNAKVNQGKHVAKTVGEHEKVLNRYIRYNPPVYVCSALLTFSFRHWLGHLQREADEKGAVRSTEAEVRDRYLGEGVPVPDLVTVKDFTRYYIARSYGLIVDVPTDDSINSRLECFFTGFERTTGTLIVEEDREEVYHVSAER